MRLTKKNENDYFMVCEIDALDGLPNVKEQAKKLGQLEDIEEELGIDLLILFKAAKEGIWYRTKGKPYFDHFDISLVNKCFRKYIDYFRDYISFDFKDYGKTWALTREKLL